MKSAKLSKEKAMLWLSAKTPSINSVRGRQCLQPEMLIGEVTFIGEYQASINEMTRCKKAGKPPWAERLIWVCEANRLLSSLDF